MSMVDIEKIDPRHRHWYEEGHFARQLGHPSARAVVEERWARFEREIKGWLSEYKSDACRPLQALDAGCGDGINLMGLSRIFEALGRDAALTGIDYNELRIARARALGVARDVRVGSLDATGFADGSVDLILLNHVLEHIPAKTPVLAELRRILRPGGLFIVGVPNEGCALAQLRNNVLQRAVLRTTDHVHFFTAETLCADLEAAGFAVQRVVGESFFVPHLRVATMIGGSAVGRRILNGLGRAIPSQAAGLVAVARAPA
jgi:SAM-dependent methyltransferase